MKAKIIIKGHSLLKMEPSTRCVAKCSCGAWGGIVWGGPSRTEIEARREWHDDHKREVWRRLHPEDFKEDRPTYAEQIAEESKKAYRRFTAEQQAIIDRIEAESEQP